MASIASFQVDAKYQHIKMQQKMTTKPGGWKLVRVKDAYTHTSLSDFLFVSQDLDL